MLNMVLVVVFFVWLLCLTLILIKLKKTDDKEGNKNETVRVALSRFNPFGNVGGDQSFCLALLIRSNLGIIITSLHGRNGTRVYAREFDPGKIDKKKLSPEEKEAIKKALMIDKNNEK